MKTKNANSEVTAVKCAVNVITMIQLTDIWSESALEL